MLYQAGVEVGRCRVRNPRCARPYPDAIAEKFSTYRFADYKEHVIDLLQRVCTVSAEIMPNAGRLSTMR